MKTSHPFHIVDVFAEAPYQGNQLAVVLDADDFNENEMQRIALEMNYAETTFVNSKRQPDGGYSTRIFTPAQELPFAGHPTLGTAWVIRHFIETNSPPVIELNLGVGRVTVDFTTSDDGRDYPWFTSPSVKLGRTIEPDRIASALNLPIDEIETKAPVQELDAGIVIICVPLVSLDALKRAYLDLQAFAPLKDEGFLPFVHLFCTETLGPDNDLCARFFFDAHGVREDSATGSATACLGAYLLRHNYLSKTDFSIQIEQGYEINRPSLLFLKAREENGAQEIFVGGNVIETMRGELS